jgi:hypothetical protein
MAILLPRTQWNNASGTYNAGSNDLINVDTISSVATINLPPNPNNGTTVKIVDVTGNFGTNNCVIGRNGRNIQNKSSNMILTGEDETVEFVFYEATNSWRIVTRYNNIDSGFFVESESGLIMEFENSEKIDLE